MQKQLSQVAVGLPTPPAPVDCRVYTRQTCDLTTSCLPASAWGRQDARWPAIISDLSQGGIRLIVRRRFEKGMGLGIELPGLDGDEPYMVLAKVIHVGPLADGRWALGCQFISELDEDEVQRLLPKREPAVVPSPIVPSQLLQAAHLPAVSGNVAGMKSFAAVQLQLEVRPGCVIDCRLQRLWVPGTWPPVVGKTLTMRLEMPQSSGPALRLEILRCGLKGEHWTLLCRLLSPSWAELLRAMRQTTSPGK